MFHFFDAFRNEGFPTQFSEHKTAANVDVLEAGFILAFIILACCFYLILGGYGKKDSGRVFVRVTTSLFIGAVLMTSNFGQEWEVGHITSTTAYKAGQAAEVRVRIGLKLGLRSVNITLLRADDEKHEENNPLDNEIINYNERFSWTWDQGRLGFGPYAGKLQKEFRQAQLKGLPLPILWVADYFTVDGEGIRFGRYYRTAGWYTHIAMWSAFPCWLMANIFFLTVIRYGAFFIAVTGVLELLACILWAFIRNPSSLVIPFDEGELRTSFGINFWLTLVTGILCIIIGCVVVYFDLRYPDKIASFFGMDPLNSYEEFILSQSEIENMPEKMHLQLQDKNHLATPDDAEYFGQAKYILRRRSAIDKVQKSRFRATPQMNTEDDFQPVYLNVPLISLPRRIPE